MTKEHYRLHRYCRTCACTPGEFGDEVCDVCGTEFPRVSKDHRWCTELCRRIGTLRRLRHRLREQGGELDLFNTEKLQRLEENLAERGGK